MKETAMGMVRAAFRQTGFRLVRSDQHRDQVEGLVRELIGWHDLAEPPGVGETPLRVELLAELTATPVSEALYLVRHLHPALSAPGDVCQFGVGEGATAALLANELRDTDRALWLYDSFQGSAARPEVGPRRRARDEVSLGEALSPASPRPRRGLPGVRGGLLHRREPSQRRYVGGVLDAIERFEHAFAHTVREVRLRLDEVGFPAERTHLVAGKIDEEVTAGQLPEKVCFAFADFDEEEPVGIVLDLLHDRLSPGAVVLVDDYGFFPGGPKAAVDRFVSRHPRRYELRSPHRFAGHFAMLLRTR